MVRLIVAIALICVSITITVFTGTEAAAPSLTPLVHVAAQTEVHSIRQIPVVTKDVVF